MILFFFFQNHETTYHIFLLSQHNLPNHKLTTLDFLFFDPYSTTTSPYYHVNFHRICNQFRPYTTISHLPPLTSTPTTYLFLISLLHYYIFTTTIICHHPPSTPFHRSLSTDSTNLQAFLYHIQITT